jgi:hypothetical protein
VEVVGSSAGGWRRSKALEEVSEALKEVEGSGGSQHEASETAESSEGGRRLWRRSQRL